jgi:hypothetical protein
MSQAESEDPLYRDAVAFAREQIQREMVRKQEHQAVYNETMSSHRGHQDSYSGRNQEVMMG